MIVFTGLSCFFAIMGEFEQLAILSSCSVLLIYLGIALATIKLRVKEKDSHHFTIPGGYIVPALAIFTILWFLSNLRVNEQIAMLVFIAILTLIYFAIRLLKLDKGVKREKN